MLCPGVLPTQNLPVKSIQTPQFKERGHLNIVKDHEVNGSKLVYKNFTELSSKSRGWKLKDWCIEIFNDKMKFTKMQTPYLVPKHEIIGDISLEFTCLMFGRILPDDHIIYKINLRSVRNIRIQDLLSNIEAYIICNGLNEDDCSTDPHVVPAETDIDDPGSSKYNSITFYRPENCFLLHHSGAKCSNCLLHEKDNDKKCKRQLKMINTPASKYAPLSKTHPHGRILALQQKCKDLQNDINKMKAELPVKGVTLDAKMGADIEKIMSENSNVSAFMKMFWEEQNKLQSSSPHGVKYHPMLIRFCLSLYAKSASAYEELRSSNVLTLPSQRTLRDYRNAIKPQAGFNPEVIQQLCDTTNDLKGYQRYVVISMDEMKIKDNLVYDKSSEELIGFVDLGDPILNYGSFDDTTQLATNVLVFYIRGVASILKFPLAYINTTGAKSFQIMPLFWEAVSILEITCKLPVVALVCDGASSNRKFFKLHEYLDDKHDTEVTHRTKNLFSTELRYICFFSDAPHLMKNNTELCISFWRWETHKEIVQ